MKTVAQVSSHVRALERRNTSRDQRYADVHAVRTGDVEAVVPGLFPDLWPRPIVANMIDVAARDLAEVIAPLPAFNCLSSKDTSDSAKKFSAKRTKIATYYVQQARLDVAMISGADQYNTYGQLPFVVQPDFEKGCPMIRLDDPRGAYFDRDIYGNVTCYVKEWMEQAVDIAAKFPEHTRELFDDKDPDAQATLKVVKYCDKDQYLLFVPEKADLVLARDENLLGKVPVAVAIRPGSDSEIRGQFDDVIWTQLARAKMALLNLQAVQESVQGPLALPSDVQRLSFGPNAVVRSQNPEKIRKVATEFPQVGLAEQEMLDRDIRMGARYPESRSGDIDASIITGRGVQALLGGFDSQVKSAQTVIGATLEDVIAICFEMDEKFWPDSRKSVSGVLDGTPFEEFYTPSKDIRGNYNVDATYGYAAGMDPNRALVFLLQLRGDQLVPRAFVQRQLPIPVDVVQLQQQIDVEQIDDALKQGIFAMLSSAGIMAQQGMDVTQLLLQTSSMIENRQKGMPIHEAILKAFTPPEQAEPTAQPGLPELGAPGAAEAGPGGLGPSPGQQASGLPFGVAAGQAQLGPGGRPDLMTLLSGMASSGQPQLGARVQRTIPA